MNKLSPNSISALEEEYLYVASSSIKDAGSGLFTAIKIYKDEIISIYTGEILSTKESNKRAENKENQYFITLLNGKILDSKHTPGFAKYANDAFGSSLKNNAKISLNEQQEVCLIATKKIKTGEEIFCSYGDHYWQ